MLGQQAAGAGHQTAGVGHQAIAASHPATGMGHQARGMSLQPNYLGLASAPALMGYAECSVPMAVTAPTLQPVQARAAVPTTAIIEPPPPPPPPVEPSSQEVGCTPGHLSALLLCFLAALHGTWDLSSSTRDQTGTHYIGIAES